MGSSYASKTIAADRNQKSFKYSLEKFLQVRGADTIVAQGRKRKAANEHGVLRDGGDPGGGTVPGTGMVTESSITGAESEGNRRGGTLL